MKKYRPGFMPGFFIEGMMEKRKRIARILIVVLLVATAVTIAAALVSRNSEDKDVSFEETTIVGDMGHADGLILQRSFKKGKFLTSEVSFKDGSFDVHTGAGKVKGDTKAGSEEIEFYCHDEILKDDGLKKDMEAEAREKGESRIYCRDYLEYFEPQGKMSDRLRNFFKVPVSSDASIVWEYDDEYGDVNYGITGTDRFSLRKENLCGREYLYLPYEETFDWLMGESYEEIEKTNGYRKFLDESDIPGGYGLYEVKEDSISNVFSPDGDGRIEGLCEEDDDTLIITTCEDDVIYAYVFDAAERKILQKIGIGGGLLPTDYYLTDYSADASIIRKDGEYTFILTYDSIVILEKKDGEYVKALEYEVDDDFDIYLGKNTALSFDGKRAAIAGITSRDWEGELWNYGFDLAVIEKDGLKYYGSFKSSVDEYIKERSDISDYEFFFDKYMNLSWNENA